MFSSKRSGTAIFVHLIKIPVNICDEFLLGKKERSGSDTTFLEVYP